VIKAGLAGGEQPKSVFASVVGAAKYSRVMAGGAALSGGEYFVGGQTGVSVQNSGRSPADGSSEAQNEGGDSGSGGADSLSSAQRGLLRLRSVMEHGCVRDWGDMERVWAHAYGEMRLSAEDHPVLLTEPALNPLPQRAKAAQVFFETFNVPALYVSNCAVLSLYASGRTTGLVLDSGEGVTHCVPIFEGFAVPHSMQRADLGGRDVTRHLAYLLRRGGRAFSHFTSAEMDEVRTIKEQTCYVSDDPAHEEEKLLSGKSDKPVSHRYRLPDGNLLELGAERFRAAEVLFRPDVAGFEIPGAHELVHFAAQRCDLDLRSTLYSNIVLAGGSTLFPGYGARLLAEVTALAPKDLKIKITAPQDRQFSTWTGGSILASLTTFNRMWVSAQEYDEDGAHALRKCF
jgi:centractin